MTKNSPTKVILVIDVKTLLQIYQCEDVSDNYLCYHITRAFKGHAIGLMYKFQYTQPHYTNPILEGEIHRLIGRYYFALRDHYPRFLSVGQIIVHPNRTVLIDFDYGEV